MLAAPTDTAHSQGRPRSPPGQCPGTAEAWWLGLVWPLGGLKGSPPPPPLTIPPLQPHDPPGIPRSTQGLRSLQSLRLSEPQAVKGEPRATAHCLGPRPHVGTRSLPHTGSKAVQSWTLHLDCRFLDVSRPLSGQPLPHSELLLPRGAVSFLPPPGGRTNSEAREELPGRKVGEGRGSRRSPDSVEKEPHTLLGLEICRRPGHQEGVQGGVPSRDSC